ncbi:MAG: c-type cytochrome [Sphingobacteriales bacterium]|nr:c-type cytochrome [Sphingobacteriales bacterium]
MKSKVLVFAGSLIAFGLLSFIPRTTTVQQPWPVPDAYKNKANPLKGNAESVTEGKALYNQHCKSCHGTKGKGDGPKASQLDTECGDFTKAAFQSQTDGTLFYKTSEGRKDMPSFKKKIPDANDIWSVINYMRTLK